MSRLLWSLGHAAAAHPWRVLATWLTTLVIAWGLAGAYGGQTSDSYDVPGSPSEAASQLLRDRFPSMSGADARVVVTDPDGRRVDADLLDGMSTRLGALEHVGSVAPARLSADGDTALIALQYAVPVTGLDSVAAMDALSEAGEPAEELGLDVVYGGEVPDDALEPSGIAEGIGVLVALVVLFVAFGSVVSAGLPLAVAFLALGIGSAGFALLALVMDVSEGAPFFAAMVGIGVGIDYSLLLVTRHAEGLRAGLGPVDAAAAANATAGRSVLFAGFTVLVSLFGLRLAGLPTYASFGATTGLVVLLVVAAAVTMVPAVCGLAGRRVLPRRERQGGAVRSSQGAAIGRWATRVARRPLPWAVAGLLLLLALAAPALGMRTWPLDAGSQPATSTVRQAHDLVAREYGPGANGPLLVAIDTRRVPAAELPQLRDSLAAEPGIASVAPTMLADDRGAAVLVLEQTYAPTDERATELVRHLRDEVLPDGAAVTGSTAVFVDTSERLDERLWLVVSFVVGVSFLLLVLVFRSIVVPLKAAVLNLLSVGAAYGVLTVVFQWGWGAGLFGLPGGVPVSSFVPVMLFAVLFGLSMDYEVFLLSRIRERWLATGDTTRSVVEGLTATGRVITSAALIMIAVFMGFALEGHIAIKMLGVGMAVAILVDATVIRMVMVPATMVLLGKANWWLPGWLDRMLPHLDLEAVGTVGQPAPSSEDAELVGASR